MLAKAESSREITEGVIEFVEPDESGKIRSEIFELPEVGVAELEETIKKAASEILALSFWNTKCTQEDCEWCPVRFAP
jgi:hypothetical protein